MGPCFQAYEAFNNLKSDNSWATMITAGWLIIQCPDQVRIWRVALKAKSIAGKNITSWSISASHNGTTYETIFTSTSALLGAATKPSFVGIDNVAAYQYYRFNTLVSEGAPGVGVQYMQLYTVDNLTSWNLSISDRIEPALSLRCTKQRCQVSILFNFVCQSSLLFHLLYGESQTENWCLLKLH